MQNLHRVILQRLVLAWLVISCVIAGLLFFDENRQLDARVRGLAMSESEGVAASLDLNATDAGAHAALQQQAEALTHKHFVAVRFYDRSHVPLVEAVDPTFLPGAAPLPELGSMQGLQAYTRRMESGGRQTVQVIVPLLTASGRSAGFFAGLYLVDREMLKALEQRLLRSLLTAMLTVFATTAALYPVIFTLHRRALRDARRVLIGNVEMAAVLGAAIAQRDATTGDHNYRVTLYAMHLGEAIGVHGLAMRGLILGAFLHDIGKIGIRDDILLKDGPLDAAEFAVMQTHVERGVAIVMASEWLQQAREVIECHHEKWDGSGYPRGLKGEGIPLNARIFAIADVFDALTSQRPYKAAWSLDEALAQLRREAGRHFDPALVERFCSLAPALIEGIGRVDPASLPGRLTEHATAHFRTLLEET